MIPRGTVFEFTETVTYEGHFPRGHWRALRDLSAETVLRLWEECDMSCDFEQRLLGEGWAEEVRGMPTIYVEDGVVMEVGTWSRDR